MSVSILYYISSRLHLSETKEKIVRNLFWSVVGKVVTLLGGLFVGIVIARYLGPEQYGLMNYVISYVGLFQIIALFGLDNIEIREESKGTVPVQVVMGTAFGLKLAFAVLTVLLTVVTSWWMEADKTITLYVLIYAVSIIANTFTVIRNYFTSIVKNEYVVKSEISRTLVGIIIKLVLWWHHAPLILFVAASAFDFVLLAGGYNVAYRQIVGSMREWKFDSGYAKFLLKESFPLLLTSAAVFIYQRIDQVMIGNMIDKESVGYFSTAARFVEVMMYVPMMLTQTISPILVRKREDSTSLYADRAQRFMNLTFWGTLILSVLVSVCAFYLVRYTFGVRYLAAVPVLQVLSFKATAYALSTTAGCMLVIEGLQRYAIFRDGFGCLVCLALNYVLLPRYGIMAAAAVAIASYVCAGYIADMLISPYRHLFVRQTKTLLYGWKDIVHIKQILKN